MEMSVYEDQHEPSLGLALGYLGPYEALEMALNEGVLRRTQASCSL